ncbi:MAG: hypothetical protein QM811_24660 [Pirellulales bacterium]
MTEIDRRTFGRALGATVALAATALPAQDAARAGQKTDPRRHDRHRAFARRGQVRGPARVARSLRNRRPRRTRRRAPRSSTAKPRIATCRV